MWCKYKITKKIKVTFRERERERRTVKKTKQNSWTPDSKSQRLEFREVRQGLFEWRIYQLTITHKPRK